MSAINHSTPSEEGLDFLDVMAFLDLLEDISTDGWSSTMARRVRDNARQLAQIQQCNIEDLTLAQLRRVVVNTRHQVQQEVKAKEFRVLQAKQKAGRV